MIFYIDMLLGEKLKVVRNKIGMSQNEVAENLRISRQTVSKWENNVCLPDLVFLMLASSMFGR